MTLKHCLIGIAVFFVLGATLHHVWTTAEQKAREVDQAYVEGVRDALGYLRQLEARGFTLVPPEGNGPGQAVTR